ncbi:hypothetical protein AAD001_02080 [Colwelliaceae bacterium 6471]
MATRYTVLPEHRRLLPSVATRHTVRPEHKIQPSAGFFMFSDRKNKQ